MKKRVVVTGIGVISPLGLNIKESWSNLISSKSGITKLDDKNYDKLPCKVAAQIHENGKNFDLNQHFSKSELKSLAPASALGLLATKQCLEDANWLPKDDFDRRTTGVAVGMGMVDLDDIYQSYEQLKVGYKKLSPFFIPRILPNMAAGNISIKFGLHGPNHSVSTACATGLHAIGDAFRFIQNPTSDTLAMVCGAAEKCISPLSIAAFCRLRALSTSFNDQPELSSRPFDKKRDGFVMGEGAAMLLLEELQHAKERGAQIYAEILGYGLSGDASHLTAPKLDGTGAILAMERALKDAQINPDEVSYINAHATSTPLGDNIELLAIKTLFKHNNLAVSSTKGAHGHLLGSAGNLEAAFTIMAIKDGVLPPTLNLTEPEVLDINLVANTKQDWMIKNRRKVALKNAFGFGGTNASVCFAEYVD